MRVAITGGIAEGKSTVLSELAALGFATASSDSMAQEVLAGPQVQAIVAEKLHLPLPLDRSALRATLAGDPGARRILNQVMHPRILAVLRSTTATFIEVPLLFETCLQGEFDRVWTVTCGSEEQRQRLLARYGEGPHVDQMMAVQLRSRSKTPFSDRIIRTNQPREHVRALLLEAVKALLVA